jgi:large subunit ribosomal protein L28
MVATKRRFDPNLQKVRIIVGKAPRRVYVCTSSRRLGRGGASGRRAARRR